MADAGDVDALNAEEMCMFTMTAINNSDKVWAHNRNHEMDNAFRKGVENKIEKYMVFLVEDDTDDRRQAVSELRKSPFIGEVHCFENGNGLLEYFINKGYYNGNLIRYVPTLVILDIHMPGTGGMDVLRELKTHPLTEDIPVLILTGDTSGKVALEAYKAKANAFITKPLNLEYVHKVINTGWGWPHNRIPQ